MITDPVCPRPGHREFLDAFSDAVLLIDHKSQRIIDVNCRAHRLIGISTDRGEFEGSAAEVIATSPIGLIEGLESLLTRGEGYIDVPAGEANGPFVARARPFVDGGSSETMLIIEKGGCPAGTEPELDQLQKERAALLEMVSDPAFSVDRTGTIVSANRAVCGLGYSEEELVGGSIWSLIAPPHQEVYAKSLEAAFCGKEPGPDRPMDMLAKDGRVHQMKVRSRLIKLNGVPVELQCIAREAPPAETERAPADNVSQYRALFEQAPVAMCSVDVSDALAAAKDIEAERGVAIQEAISSNPALIEHLISKLHFIDVNQECLGLFHAKSKEEFYGGHGAMFSESPLPVSSSCIGSMMAGRPGKSSGCTVRTLDGEERSVELRWDDLPDQGRRLVLLSFADRTDRMTSFKRLESEKRFDEAIIDFAESLIVGMDMEGTVMIFNRKAEQTTGMKRQDVLGKNYFTLFDAETDAQGGKAWLSEMAQGKRSVERIKALPGKGARPIIWWHNTIVQSGDRLVMVGIGVDITERVSLNRRLEDLNESLLLLNRIMRHDIMNDLNVAIGSIQMYRTKREDRFLDSATRSLTKSVDLINDISDMERLRTPTELRPVQVREVIDKVVEGYAGHNVLIRVTGEGRAMADETLSSVIDNLLGNSIMHGHTDAVEIEVKNDHGQCLIVLADRGKGIPDEIKARIFDEGFKFGKTGNTGFGLYIVKKTMERYGGAVMVRDNLPQGAVFELRLLAPAAGPAVQH